MPSNNDSTQLGEMRDFGDPEVIRHAIYDKTLNAARNFQPVIGPRYTLELADVDYADPETFTKADEKRALLEGHSLGRRMRGTWRLKDTTTGALVDSKKTTLASVPYMTPRGTFIVNGNDYVLSHQMRLSPGIFTRVKESGELESHINVARGHGHRYFLDPETGVFRAEFGQSRMPLISILRALGAKDDAIREAWGNELYAANMRKDSPNILRKVYRKLRHADAPPGTSVEQSIRDTFAHMLLDPEVTKLTLGNPYDKVDVDTILATTKKLLRVYRGEEQPDDRDNMAYQRLVGPEDLFAERVTKSRDAARKLLWRAAAAGSAQSIPANAFKSALRNVLLESGLGNAVEEINPAEVYDQLWRATRMGEGGIPSIDAVPDSSRNVNATQFGYIDPIVTPESGRIGVDNRLALNTRKGPNGLLYSRYLDPKTNEDVWKSPRDVTGLTVAFPGEMESGEPYVRAISRGKHRYVKREAVDLQFPDMTEAMGPIANLIPLKGSAYPQRLAMGSRMITQALPLVNAESQLVQAAIPGTDDTFAHKYAERMGAVRSKVAGTVVDITPDTITVRGPDRRNHVVELYNEMPYNRKTTVHNTPLVRVGQRVSPGMLLAKSNFTDNDGTIALGVNARVGYIPYKGYSYEDAIVVSESFADRTTSEHMYQHTLDTGAGVQPDKNAHISIFQGKYPKKLLENYAPDGTIKPGTKVNPGEPLILAVKENTIGPRIGRRKSWADASVLWEHEAPGVVTDVAYGKRGINVIVKSTQKTRVGDKLCFDPETELLTRRGWKCVATIDSADELATLNPDNDCLEWHKPTMLHSYNHVGQMYRLVNRRVNMLVTPEHTLWACRPGKAYTKIAARDFYAARGEWYLKKDCLWQGVERALYVPPEHVAGSGRAHAFSTPVPMDVWLEFLGYYISEGSVHTQRKGGKYVRISQFKTSKHWKKIGECLDKLGLPWKYSDADQRFQVGSCALAAALAPCGHDAYTKRVPEYVQELSTRQLRIFFDAYMAGDGHRGVCWEFGTSSEQLSFDMSLIVFKLGYSTYTREVWGTGFQTHPHWRTRISRTQLRPYINKANVNKGKGTTEELTDYSGMVYCVTVANHLVYARRGGKSYWSGNSGQYG